MALHRFYAHPSQIFEETVCIRGTDVWHISKALRLSINSEVVVFDGTGREYRVRLTKKKPREILGTILDRWERHSESPLHLTLAQVVPKSQKMDLIVQKATEIGVQCIVPLSSRRNDPNIPKKGKSEEAIAKKLDRWTRIGVEAAKQSQRSALPTVESLLTIDEFLAQDRTADLKLVLWEEETQRRFKQVARSQPTTVHSAIIVIGPEGGLTADEVEQFRANGYQSISFGPRILRTETAGLVMAAILQYEYGDFGNEK